MHARSTARNTLDIQTGALAFVASFPNGDISSGDLAFVGTRLFTTARGGAYAQTLYGMNCSGDVMSLDITTGKAAMLENATATFWGATAR